MKIFLDKKGSALLVAMLIMSVLLVVGLGINKLIIAELRVERTLVEGGQSFYVSEGASELGLYDVFTNIVGYEVVGETGEVDNGAEWVYSIEALSDVWPCDVYGDKVVEDDSGYLWRVLGVEESVMIPLFSNEWTTSDFTIYYDIQTETGIYPSDEVLRWKILGIDGEGFTEAISSYDAVSPGGSYWQAFTETAGTYQEIGASWGGRQYEWTLDENISYFLGQHSYNYLILTNISADSGEGDELYVRLDDGDTEFVCEYIKIEADGVKGEYVSQVDVLMKEGEPLPVFDFVLWEKSN